MIRWQTAAGLCAFGLLLLPAAVRADRIASSKVQIQPNPGTRPEVYVPYTTNGINNLGVYQGISPRTYASPVVEDTSNPGARPVFNIPFYGGVQSFGGLSNGAVPRATRPFVGR